jgi:ribosomal protein S27AE
MPAKAPWLPTQLQPGATPEPCPRCARRAFIAWTLRRDDHTKQVWRTWVCTECQFTEERPEPE